MARQMLAQALSCAVVGSPRDGAARPRGLHRAHRRRRADGHGADLRPRRPQALLRDPGRGASRDDGGVALAFPLVGEGGLARSAKTDEGCWTKLGRSRVTPILDRYWLPFCSGMDSRHSPLASLAHEVGNDELHRPFPLAHRPENRHRFSESTMRRFNNLERPLCVHSDARRSSLRGWRLAEAHPASVIPDLVSE